MNIPHPEIRGMFDSDKDAIIPANELAISILIISYTHAFGICFGIWRTVISFVFAVKKTDSIKGGWYLISRRYTTES